MGQLGLYRYKSYRLFKGCTMKRRAQFTSSAKFNYRPVEQNSMTQKECLDRNKLKIRIKRKTKWEQH